MASKYTKITLDLYHWIEKMVKLRARACVISQLTNISNLEARTIYKEIAGKSSPPGQLPTNMEWFLDNSVRRSHSALLIGLYLESIKSMEHYCAFTHAFYHYARLTSPVADRDCWRESKDPAYRDSEEDYVIPFTRGNLLVTRFASGLNGVRKCEISMIRCRRCQGHFISDHLETNNVCLVCSKQKVSA